MQMLVRLFLTATRDRVLGRFQLHDHTGETLRESVVDVPHHSIAFFEDRRALTLLGKLIELKRKHDLVSECLSQLDFFWSIRRTVDVANADKTAHVPTHQQRHAEKSLCA